MNGGRGSRWLCRTKSAGVVAAFVLVSIVQLGLGALPAAGAPCGDPGQRACCNGAGEFSNLGTACNCGAVIAAGCSGDCQCGGSIFSAADHCVAISPPCGGDGERGCCTTEPSCSGACDDGLTEVNGCTGNCSCSNSHCRLATHCGGDGERACCGGELIAGRSCGSGLIESNGCSGDCFCGGSANPFAINSSGHCIRPSHCGGAGERACCTGTVEFAPGSDTGGLCEPGKVPIPGCVGDCQCGGPTAVEGVNALDTCVTATPCGGENERACCISEGPTRCDDGLDLIPGCTGNCFCPGGKAGHTCLKLTDNGKLQKAPQPDTGRATAPGEPRACALSGYADLHVHMFSDTGHGGGVLSGASYDPVTDDINVALRPDQGTHRDLVTKTGAELPAPSCDSWNPDCGEKLFHGDHFPLIDDAVGSGTGDDTASPLGAPAFNGWPTWHTTTHQQVYYKWLERAYQGGLRLISMLAVTNEALCLSNKHQRGVNCADSMAAVDAQLDEALAFETFLDNKSGGPGMGWFRIVRTPAEARQVIADGKLAVVLGIEVDNLFNCHWANRDDTTGPCSPDGIRQKVQEYYDRGVRHVFPIHNFDNAFGGPATWQDAIDVGNRASEGHWWSPLSPTDATSAIIDCSPQGYGFKLSCLMQGVITLLGFPSSVIPLNDPFPCHDVDATCNTLGLTQRGRDLITAFMDNGMIIDVDHMSINAIAETLALAQSRDYPLVASHVQFFDLNQGSQRHERMRTRAQLEAIRNGGGMIAAMLKDDGQDSLGGKEKKVNVAYTTSPSGVSIPDDCRHSTKTYAQAYQYAVDVMGGPVALGSDFNGVAGHVGPRFGPDACGSVLAEQGPEEQEGNRLQYPFDLGAGYGTFGKQVTGAKTFDFNVDGLAHIGLLPDLVADLNQVGLPQEYLDDLFGSAEEFIRVWEKGAGIPSGTPTATCQAVTVDADASCFASASIATDDLRNNPALTLTQDPPGPYPIGRTSVRLTVTSSQSCVTDTCIADVVVRDAVCRPANPPCESGEVCNPATRSCDALPDASPSTPCDADGDRCTNDHCDGAGSCVLLSQVTCPGPNPPCEGGEACNPGTGACEPQPDAAPTTPCQADDNFCTNDHCDGSGACVFLSDVVCSALDQCHVPGTCDPGTGVCDNPNKADGQVCDDDNVCTSSDQCTGGVCSGRPTGGDADGDGYCDLFETQTGCNPNDAKEIPPQAATYPGTPGAVNVILTYTAPSGRRVYRATDPSCATVGACAPPPLGFQKGFCTAGRIGDACTTNTDCNESPNTCRVVLNYADLPDLSLDYVKLNGLPTMTSLFTPVTRGCTHKADVPMDTSRRVNRLRFKAHATVGGRRRNDRDTFGYR